eukprot:TRINITY_DN5679_c0_g1_i2.p1 TRINITY_DN5679_c0_g1~~TRINITY_DN5679_c0_g1_i2.p1  ORF type:complete len:193 (-),score=35.58 TRINITY_DN5679_c0_g1_i2:92-670(-)
MVNLGSEDYYRNLGVDPQASPEEIEDSYFRLSYRWAPEKNPGSQLARHTYNLIAQAYTTLIDPVTRAAYDKEHCFEPPVAAALEGPADRSLVLRLCGSGKWGCEFCGSRFNLKEDAEQCETACEIKRVPHMSAVFESRMLEGAAMESIQGASESALVLPSFPREGPGAAGTMQRGVTRVVRTGEDQWAGMFG